MITNPQFTAYLGKCQEVAAFCAARGGVCFKDWPPETLLYYVIFHSMAGTISVIRTQGVISSVAFGWRASRTALEKCHALGLSCFEWRIGGKDSDCVFIAEVIGDLDACKHFVRQARVLWPDMKDFVTFRGDAMVSLGALMERLAR